MKYGLTAEVLIEQELTRFHNITQVQLIFSSIKRRVSFKVKSIQISAAFGKLFYEEIYYAIVDTMC